MHTGCSSLCRLAACPWLRWPHQIDLSPFITAQFYSHSPSTCYYFVAENSPISSSPSTCPCQTKAHFSPVPFWGFVHFNFLATIKKEKKKVKLILCFSCYKYFIKSRRLRADTCKLKELKPFFVSPYASKK